METARQCFLNGEILPLAQARISPLDRGFLFGDGVYEVIPVYDHRPFYWRRHIARLAKSLAEISLGFNTDALRQAAEKLIAAEPSPRQALYIQITRGEMAQRQLTISPQPQPTVFMMTSAYPPPAADKLAGVHCHTAKDIRWGRNDIKSISLLGAALLAPAADSGSEEVMIFRNDILSEGSRSNFIIVKDGVLAVPIADNRNLNGITYQLVCELAQAGGITVTVGDINTAAVMAADEILLTSSLREILPVTRLNDIAVGGGVAGKVFGQLHLMLQQHINSGDWHNG